MDPGRWQQLVLQFRQDNFKLHQLSTNSVFYVVLQAGLSALKTPYPISMCACAMKFEHQAQPSTVGHLFKSMLCMLTPSSVAFCVLNVQVIIHFFLVPNCTRGPSYSIITYIHCQECQNISASGTTQDWHCCMHQQMERETQTLRPRWHDCIFSVKSGSRNFLSKHLFKDMY